MSILVPIAHLCFVNSFLSPFHYIPNVRIVPIKMTLPGDEIVLVGLSGGVAENIAFKLKSSSYNLKTLLDRRPISPYIQDLNNLYTGEIGGRIKGGVDSVDLPAIFRERVVIAVDDTGDMSSAGKISLSSEETKYRTNLFNKLKQILQPPIKALICISSYSDETNKNPFGQLLGPGGLSPLRKWCQDNNTPFTSLTYGQLIGSTPGNEPLPFLGFPLLEPELDPSYVLRSVVFSKSSSKYAKSDICTREVLAEAAIRVASIWNTQIEAQVISIAGNPPSEKQWNEILARAASVSDVELLRVDFGAIIKPAAFTSWLTDIWFPQALIDADAATILAGARPVRATKIEEGIVRIYWEDMDSNLSVRKAGEHEIRVVAKASAPHLSVVRLSPGALPGESQLMERLLEEINKNVYKKQFCVPTEL